MYSQDTTSIETFKLLQLKRDLEQLQPGHTALLGRDKIIAELRPVISDALKRGCSPSSVMSIVQGYKLQISPIDLGISQRY